MTHASSARQLTARTKTANGMGSDTIAVAVDRRDGPAFIEDRPYGRPDTVVAMALADHAFKAGRQPGDDGVTI